MRQYHKIKTVFNRNEKNNFKTIVLGDYSTVEFEYLAYNEWMWTEKVDGTNIRVIYTPSIGFEYRGKTDNAQLHPLLLDALSRIFSQDKINICKEVFKEDTTLVTFYGEGYGPKIQTGGKYREDQSFVLFDVLINDIWLRRSDVEDIAEKLAIDVVPIIGYGTLTDMVDYCKYGFKSKWGDFVAEGIVATPLVDMYDRLGRRIITKIKYSDFE